MKHTFVVLGLLLLTACSGGGSPGLPGSPPVSVNPPLSVAPLMAGVYMTPWGETPGDVSALDDLHPDIVRINDPAFGIVRIVIDAPERARLIGLIETEIAHTRATGSQALIITSLSLQDHAPSSVVVSDAPALAAYYAEYAKRMPGNAYELGNEAEIGGNSNTAIDPQSYATYFQIISKAIKSADPTALTITAGTSGFHSDWIRSVLADGAKPDAVGVHPYGASPSDYARLVHGMGVNLPVWFTEYGQTYDGTSSQAQAVQDYYSFSKGVVPVAVWFSLSDLSAERPAQFGLLDALGARRESYFTAQNAIKTLGKHP